MEAFVIWLLGGGLSVVLAVFTALALPTFDFAYLELSGMVDALFPLVSAASWAIDFTAIEVAFDVMVLSMTAYTIAVFYWHAIGKGFMNVGNSLMPFSGTNIFDTIKTIILGFLGIPQGA